MTDVFLTPDAPPLKDKIHEIRIVKRSGKEVESNKRQRSDEEESDVESYTSDTSSYRELCKSKKKTKKEDKLNKSMMDIPTGDEEERDEEDTISAIRELERTLSKIKSSTREIKAYTSVASNNVKNMVKLHAGQADRLVDSVRTKLKNIELRLENKKLKQSIQMRDIGTQSSPISSGIGHQEIGQGKGNTRNNRKEKGKGMPSRNTVLGTTEGETDTDEVTTDRGENRGGKKENRKKGGYNKDNKEEWSVVERNKKKEEKRLQNKQRKEEEEKEMRRREEEREKVKRRNIPNPPKTEAIIIKPSENRTFANLFKQLKDNAGDKMEGIQTIRKSRGGDLIIEMEKDANGSGFEKVVKDTLGADYKVRRMTPRVTYEIKDVDPTLDREELTTEIAREIKLEQQEIQVKSIRFGYGGTKTAIVSLPSKVISRLDSEVKIKLGFTNCRIRRAQNLIRCFKCHEFGHLSYNCRVNTNGQEICRRCGTTGHQIDGCQAIRCCVLCTRKGVPAANAEHVAGAVNCLQYKSYLQQLAGSSSQNSI